MKIIKTHKNQRGEAHPVLIGIAAVIFLLALTWAFQGNDFFLYKAFAPKYEQVRHDTFKQSQAYNDGMVQELRKAQLDYEKAGPEHKAAIGSVVLHQFASYDESRLPNDLQAFVAKLRREQMTPEKL